jgi:hypothetical protein
MGMDALKEHYQQAGMKRGMSLMLEVVKLVGALLMVLFATTSSAEAAIESVVPKSGGTVWTTNFPPGGTFTSAEAACGSLNASSCPVCGSLSYVGTTPNLSYPNYMNCVLFYNPGDGTPGHNIISGTALSSSNAVCPTPTLNPTIPYVYNIASGMCERTMQDCPIHSSGTFPNACVCDAGYKIDAAKTSCVPDTCPIDRVVELTDPVALQYENGTYSTTKPDIDHLTSAAQSGLACIKQKVNALNCYMTPQPTSGYRPTAYQKHLLDVYDQWQKIKNNRDPICADTKASIKKEFDNHSPFARRPADPSVMPSNHSQLDAQGNPAGNAVDISFVPDDANIHADGIACQCNMYRPLINMPDPKKNDPVHYQPRTCLP